MKLIAFIDTGDDDACVQIMGTELIADTINSALMDVIDPVSVRVGVMYENVDDLVAEITKELDAEKDKKEGTG